MGIGAHTGHVLPFDKELELTSPPASVSPLRPVYRLVGGLGYVAFETPQGTLRFSLQQPTVKSCDPLKSDACKDDFAPLTTLPYCNQSSGGGGGGNSSGGNSSNGSVVPPRQFAKMPCTYWDSIQNAIVGQVRAGCVLAVDWRQGRAVLGKKDGGVMLRGGAGAWYRQWRRQQWHWQSFARAAIVVSEAW